MRKLLLACALYSGMASASDYSTSFALNGTVYDTRYSSMELDITAHKRFLAVNGALVTDNGLLAPLSGTCQFKAGSGGVYCILQQAHMSFLLDLSPNFAGTLRALDQDGNNVSTLAVTFSGMK